MRYGKTEQKILGNRYCENKDGEKISRTRWKTKPRELQNEAGDKKRKEDSENDNIQIRNEAKGREEDAEIRGEEQRRGCGAAWRRQGSEEARK